MVIVEEEPVIQNQQPQVLDPNNVEKMTRTFVDKSDLFARLKDIARKNIPNVRPQDQHDRRLVIVAGAANVIPYYGKIKEMYDERTKPPYTDFVAINGMLDICNGFGVVPQYVVMVDPQDKHARYFKNPPKETTYLIASQCSPLVFKALKKNKVLTYHVSFNQGEQEYLDSLKKPYMLCTPGSTAGLSAITMGYIMGYRDFHMFGFDGALDADGQSHAYGNEMKDIQEITLGGRKFMGPLWGIIQSYDFQTLCRTLPGLNIHMYGDGLLPHTLHVMEQELQNGAKTESGVSDPSQG